MSGPVYRDVGVAVLRAPALPGALVGALDDPGLTDGAFLARAWSCAALADAVRLTSPDLAAQVTRLLEVPDGDVRVLVGAADGLTRYLLRAALRPTPYGVLSGVAAVQVTAGLTAGPPGVTGPLERHVSADRVFVSRLVSSLEAAADVQACLPYRGHGGLHRRGGRLLLDATLGGPAGLAPVTARPASAARVQVTDARRPAQSYAAVAADLQRQGSSAQAARQFLDDLVAQGFLQCALQPSVTDVRPLDTLLARLPVDLPGPWRERLLALQGALNRWGDLPADAQVGEYRRLMAAVREWAPGCPDVPLHGRLPLTPESAVPAAWVPALEPALDALRRLHAPVPAPPWPAYLERFEVRYGLQEVPLLDLLDDERGLGPPPRVPEPDEDSAAWLTPEADAWLLGLAGEALHRQALDVTLPTADLMRLEPQAPFPPSAAALIRPRRTADGVRLALAPAGFMVPVGRALGRFALHSDALTAALQGTARADERRHAAAGLLVADVQVDGRDVSLQALTAHPAAYGTAISASAGDAATHGLADVRVGVRDGRFTLRLHSTGQRFVTRTLHALVDDSLPHAARFLHGAGRDHPVSAYRWHWGSAAHLPRTPRVHVGEVTLTPARWRVPDRFRSGTLDDRFDEWCAQWSVPPWVAVGEFDQKLSLRRDHPRHRRLLARELRRGARHLEEVWDTPGEGWLTGPDGQRSAEVLLPMEGTAPPPAVAAHAPLREGTPAPGESRVLRPGGPCLYLRVYGPRAEQDDVIRAAMATCPPGRWFFTRYQDPHHHVRLRIFGAPDDLWGPTFTRLTAALDALARRDLVWSYQVDAYEREVERYGGWPGLRLAEEVFTVDSRAALEWRAARRTDWPLSVSLAASVDRFTRPFLPDVAQRADLYGRIHAGRQLDAAVTRRWSAAFGTHRERLIAAFQAGVPAPGPLAGIAESLREADGAGHLTRPLVEVLPSLIHMHCNRHGADESQEWLTTFYLKKLLAGFQHHRPDGLAL